VTREQEQLGQLRAGLSGYLSRRILRLIQEEELRPGDRLPSVKSLAERFSVAAPTLREALRQLQAGGVIEMRHGSGVYVRNGHERIVLANPSRREIEASTIIHLLDARLLIEPRLAELTARAVDETKIAELERILDEAEQCLTGNDEMLHRTNMSFHAAVAKFAGNFVLAQIIESLIELYSFEQLAIMSFYDDRLGDHSEHRAILAAIRAKDAGRARELMHRHLQGVKTVVERKLGEKSTRDVDLRKRAEKG
jgi:GntR family transcriptional regulator, transcriptional repressor for pyruvate dehydrogenase complex